MNIDTEEHILDWVKPDHFHFTMCTNVAFRAAGLLSLAKRNDLWLARYYCSLIKFPFKWVDQKEIKPAAWKHAKTHLQNQMKLNNINAWNLYIHYQKKRERVFEVIALYDLLEGIRLDGSALVRSAQFLKVCEVRFDRWANIQRVRRLWRAHKIGNHKAFCLLLKRYHWSRSKLARIRSTRNLTVDESKKLDEVEDSLNVKDYGIDENEWEHNS
jgi:hypothetical protein